jgi:hypothetical protein
MPQITSWGTNFKKLCPQLKTQKLLQIGSTMASLKRKPLHIKLYQFRNECLKRWLFFLRLNHGFLKMIALSIYLDPNSKKQQPWLDVLRCIKVLKCCPDPERILEIYYFRVLASDEFEIEHEISDYKSQTTRSNITRSSVRENTAVFLRKLIMLQVLDVGVDANEVVHFSTISENRIVF